MPEENNLRLSISAKKIAKGLFTLCIVLFCLNLIGIFFKIYQAQDNFMVNMIYFFFNAANEGSVQTLFSSLQLLIAAAIVVIIGLMLLHKDDTKKYWFVLGVIFSYLALDESVMIHEQFNKLRPVLNDQSGFLHFTWVLPYAGLVILAGFFFFRFLLVLPPVTRNLFVISGIIYAGAAIGFELAEGYIAHNGGIGTYGDVLLPPVEEFFEMCGITLFIYAALRHARTLQKDIVVTIT